MGFLRKLFGRSAGHNVEELARRLGMDVAEMRAVPVAYRRFQIPKRAGGVRTIHAPEDPLKQHQRRVLGRILARLPVHSAATGFQQRHSIVTNAAHHTGKAIILQLDIQDYFPSTTAKRIRSYFQDIGWNNEAAKLLTLWCTQDGGLPQGAPTSPRLSNLVNYRLDARMAGLAAKFGAAYTRYADDLTFSFASDDQKAMRRLLFSARMILNDFGYRPHHKRKCHIRRKHQRQIVTGLVVNDRPTLPRETRRWLRAVEHHIATNRPATVTPQQLAGWRALQSMIQTQREQLQR